MANVVERQALVLCGVTTLDFYDHQDPASRKLFVHTSRSTTPLTENTIARMSRTVFMQIGMGTSSLPL